MNQKDVEAVIEAGYAVKPSKVGGFYWHLGTWESEVFPTNDEAWEAAIRRMKEEKARLNLPPGVKQKTVYVAKDGREFDTPEKAGLYAYSLEIEEYLYNHPDLDWHDICPRDVLEALLERYRVVPKSA